MSRKNVFYGVFGLGLSGKATLAFLEKNNYKAIAWDDSTSNLSDGFKNIKFCDLENPEWNNIECLILSPGVPLHYPEPHEVVKIARKNNVEIICDVELLYRHYPDNKYIGITGTNGKSTTTSLIAHIFDSNNLPHKILGNIGTAALSATPAPEDTLIIEISSYQLDLVKEIHFNNSILLNITPDHLDRHGSIENYTESKYKIFNNQNSKDQAILNSALEAQNISANIVNFSGTEVLKTGVSVSKNRITFNGTHMEVNLPHSLQGTHNYENVAAAFAAVKYSTNLTSQEIARSIESFEGLAHRMELVGDIANLRFVNDSKGTNFESTKYSLENFKNIYWIAGGKAKKGGIEGIEKFADNIKLAFLVGESQKSFAAELDKCGIPYHYSESLELAFVDATQEAQRNKQKNTILLSPAAASLDQWKNFEERGDYFTTLVRKYVTTHQKNFQL